VSRRTCRSVFAGLVVCLGVFLAVERTTAQPQRRDPDSCHGAVISALAASGVRPSDVDDVTALQEQVRSACAALDPEVQRFTVEIDGVTVGGVVGIRLVPAK
jgi:hypothetical protein